MIKKKDKLEITEIFMAKAGKHGWDRCFYGTIQRGLESDGSSVVRGKIKVKEGFVLAQAGCQDELGSRLDELVYLTVEYDLQANPNPDNYVSMN